MKILLTGATGFLGQVIWRQLSEVHQIVTLSKSSKSAIVCDLGTEIPELPMTDLVIHAAGKAHFLPKDSNEEAEFYAVNTKGTENLLQALDKKLPKSLVFISTVAVYGVEYGQGISENWPLLGNSAYAKSKILAEEMVLNWSRRTSIPCVILRLPLITGTNPPGNLKALIQSIKQGYYFRVGKGMARKSMVGAEDVANLIPTLVNIQGVYNLTDGIHPPICDVDQHIALQLNKAIRSLPLSFFNVVAKVGSGIPGFPLTSERLEKLTAPLTFSDEKARNEIGWKPNSALNFLRID